MLYCKSSTKLLPPTLRFATPILSVLTMPFKLKWSITQTTKIFLSCKLTPWLAIKSTALLFTLNVWLNLQFISSASWRICLLSYATHQWPFWFTYRVNQYLGVGFHIKSIHSFLIASLQALEHSFRFFHHFSGVTREISHGPYKILPFWASISIEL